MIPDQSESVAFDPRAYVALFVFRWKIIAVCVLLFLTGGVLYMTWAPRLYRTGMVAMLWRDPALAVASQASEMSSMRFYTWLLSGEELQLSTVQKLESKWREKMGGLRRMKLAVSVAQDRQHGALLNISVKHSNPGYVEEYLATLWDEFMTKQGKMREESSRTAIRVLEDELQNLAFQIRQSEDDLIDYARMHEMDLTSVRASVENRYVLALLTYQNQLNTELMLLNVTFPMLDGEDATVIRDAEGLVREGGAVAPMTAGEASLKEGEEAVLTGSATERAVADNPEVLKWQGMKMELMRQEIRLRDLLAKFTPEHQEVREAKKRVEELKDQLRIASEVAFGRLRARYKALKIAWQALETPIRTWKNTFQQASKKQADYRRKSLEVERHEAMYKDLYGRLNDLRVSEEMKSDHFIPLGPLRTETDPVWPDAKKVMFMTVVLALGSGFGLALVAHAFDNRMQTIADVERVLRVPFLGGIPRWIRSGEDFVSRPIVDSEDSSGAVEAYRVLRTSVMSALDKAGQKVLLFTSAEAREGKTITALNLAVMTARVGKKVLLIDADTRRPRLHKSFKLGRENGVTDALLAGRPLGEYVKETAYDNLRFVSGGSECLNAAEMLQAADMEAFLSSVRRDYDYILVDTSPVLRAADAGILAGTGFCSVVLVVRVDRTPKPLIRYSLDFLGNSHVLGVVMNDIDMNKISSLYYSYQYPNYAYYAYAYAYGYEYDYYADGVKIGRRAGKRPRRFALGAIGRAIRRLFLPME